VIPVLVAIGAGAVFGIIAGAIIAVMRLEFDVESL
jgi:ribose/xylose/arabinose/galactoside ABC-type transport system permease subunit